MDNQRRDRSRYGGGNRFDNDNAPRKPEPRRDPGAYIGRMPERSTQAVPGGIEPEGRARRCGRAPGPAPGRDQRRVGRRTVQHQRDPDPERRREARDPPERLGLPRAVRALRIGTSIAVCRTAVRSGLIASGRRARRRAHALHALARRRRPGARCGDGPGLAAGGSLRRPERLARLPARGGRDRARGGHGRRPGRGSRRDPPLRLPLRPPDPHPRDQRSGRVAEPDPAALRGPRGGPAHGVPSAPEPSRPRPASARPASCSW